MIDYKTAINSILEYTYATFNVNRSAYGILHSSVSLVIPTFFFRKKGYINFVSKSVRTSVRHVSCKCISS